MSKTFNLAILSRNLDTTGNNINIDDNEKFLVGTSNDLEIVHNGSDSVINDAGLGSLLLQSGGSTKLEVNATGVNIFGPLAVSSTVDGRDISVDGLKLDGIEANATADQTDAEIKTAYENNADTNAFTDAEKTKVANALTDADFTDPSGVKAIDQGLSTTDDVTFNQLTLTADLHGPSTFTIDPATVGDNTGTVVIAGNLTVNGTTTTVNSNTVNIGDNIITLNSDETGTPSQNAGIEIERGTDTNKTFLWNETNDAWTADGAFTATGVAAFTDSTASTSSSTGAVLITGGTGIGGALNVAGTIGFTNNTASTSSSTGAMVVTGGVGIGGALHVAGVITGPTTATLLIKNSAGTTLKTIRGV